MNDRTPVDADFQLVAPYAPAGDQQAEEQVEQGETGVGTSGGGRQAGHGGLRV